MLNAPKNNYIEGISKGVFMIRKAKYEDKEQIVRLFKQLHRYHCKIAPHKHIMPRENFFSERISQAEADGNSVMLVNDDNNSINAYALFRIIETGAEEKPPRKVCFIDCIGVEESTRRKGIGKTLFEGVKAYARKAGCNAVQLSVDAENKDAREFYKKMGLLPRSIILAGDIQTEPEQPSN